MPESVINQIIANNLNKFMRQNNVTQLDLAEYMEVSQATISNWCKGIKMPRMDKIDKICNYFNIKRSDLMENKSDQSKSQTSFLLSDLEKEIITKYRQADDVDREMVHRILHMQESIKKKDLA